MTRPASERIGNEQPARMVRFGSSLGRTGGGLLSDQQVGRVANEIAFVECCSPPGGVGDAGRVNDFETTGCKSLL